MRNPFATSAVMPGKLAFLFADPSQSLDELVRRFHANHHRGRIVGPHGTGKSTLLRNLIERLAASIEFVQFNPAELAAQGQLPTLHVSKTDCVLVIDGMEQLPNKLVRQITRWTASNNVGLLFTCHRSEDETADLVPVLFRSEPDREVFVRLARQLSEPSGVDLAAADLHTVFDKHGGNFREALFELYDRMESITER